MAIFIATYFKKHIFEPLFLKFKLLPNFGFGLLWPSGFRRCLGSQLVRLLRPGDLWVKIVETWWSTLGKQG